MPGSTPINSSTALGLRHSSSSLSPAKRAVEETADGIRDMFSGGGGLAAWLGADPSLRLHAPTSESPRIKAMRPKERCAEPFIVFSRMSFDFALSRTARLSAPCIRTYLAQRIEKGIDARRVLHR